MIVQSDNPIDAVALVAAIANFLGLDPSEVSAAIVPVACPGAGRRLSSASRFLQAGQCFLCDITATVPDPTAATGVETNLNTLSQSEDRSARLSLAAISPLYLRLSLAAPLCASPALHTHALHIARLAHSTPLQHTSSPGAGHLGYRGRDHDCN